jgi:hypothetical protein
MPIKPDVANYEKRLDAPASNTPGNTPASGASQAVVAGGKPKNASEMTAAGRDAYKIDLSEYREEKGDYDRERQNITFLCSWITKTVAANLFDATCDPEKKIHEWYAALKERVGTNDLQELRRATEEWETANKTLSRKPKDMLSWLKGWELAFMKAQKAKVPGTNDSKIWWLKFDNTVRGFGYDGWCDSYYNSNQDAIDNNNFVLQKLLNDFSERIRRSDDSKPRTIAKGAFVTFAEQTSDEEERDSEPRRSTQRSPASRRERSRSPTPRTTNKRRYTGGSTSGCPACDRQHRLEDCWAARPEIRPGHVHASKLAEGRAQERMDRDPELCKRVEQLRKRVKKEGKNTAAPLKSALKESDSQSRVEEER